MTYPHSNLRITCIIATHKVSYFIRKQNSMQELSIDPFSEFTLYFAPTHLFQYLYINDLRLIILTIKQTQCVSAFLNYQCPFNNHMVENSLCHDSWIKECLLNLISLDHFFLYLLSMYSLFGCITINEMVFTNDFTLQLDQFD